MSETKKKIIMVCSGGGHLSEILELEELFEKYDYLLVTEKTPFTSYYADSYNVKFINPRSNGKQRFLSFYMTILTNFFHSAKILIKHYPKAIISTGSHTAIPMCLLGRLLRIKIVFILSYSRVNTCAKSADVIYRIANKFIVQWPGAMVHYKKALFLGGIYR